MVKSQANNCTSFLGYFSVFTCLSMNASHYIFTQYTGIANYY